jgi:hypothetical protein
MQRRRGERCDRSQILRALRFQELVEQVLDAENAGGFFGAGVPGIRVSPEFTEFVIRQCLDCSARATVDAERSIPAGTTNPSGIGNPAAISLASTAALRPATAGSCARTSSSEITEFIVREVSAQVGSAAER